MRKILIIIAVSFVIALLNLGLTSVTSLSLIWLVVVGLLFVEWEDYAIVFALLSGLFFDIMKHGDVGITSLGILIGGVIYVLAKSLGLGRHVWQKIVAALLIFLVAFGADALLHLFLEGGGLSQKFLGYRLQQSLLHAFLSLGAYGIILMLKNRYSSGAEVKL